MSTMAQSDYDKSIDPENKDVIYKGEITFDDLMKEPAFSWMKKGADEYTPDHNAIVYLQKELPAYDIITFLGTWCEDSQQQIPKLYKVLTEANYPLRHLSLYGVDRTKATKYLENKLYKIERVPTIILLKKGKEIGRIVETPEKSIEEDMVNIIKADKAKF